MSDVIYVNREIQQSAYWRGTEKVSVNMNLEGIFRELLQEYHYIQSLVECSLYDV
ncbi:hypothetical protein V6M85_07870 [Sulfolobus tengchongensis]|uniref:Uncharacterized protein n=1 Tax=Sulfolobus tengchongensis TaxID=207809 RepID=A0AAX4KX07_9CREN